MKDLVAKLTNKKSLSYVETVGGFFKSLPHLPKGLVMFLVKLTPYFAILSAVFSLLFGPIVTLVSLLLLLTKSATPVFFSTLLLSLLFFASGVVLFLAFKPLKNRQQTGWVLLFWAEVIMLVETIVRITFGQTRILSLLGTALGFYVLFEMRSFYKKK
jgi:hypothetical protein